MSFGLNQVVGNYECLAIIDKPRAGVTYKVRNLATGELEALRALPGAVARDPESTERLLREIRVHTRLTHPNVVGFHDAFELEGQLVMTTDYVDGGSLAQRCSDGPLSADEAVEIIFHVLLGLEEAHALGIVHRGISAEHVIVGRDAVVKLGGFDLAKPASDTNLTKVGAVIGDPRYISPEQVIGKSDLDPRSDLYSVGVLLYLTLTGKMPFEGRNDFEVLSAQVSSIPQRPTELNPSLSPELEQVVLRALRKNPEERFANASEFRDALVAAANAPVAAAPVAERPAMAPLPVVRKSGARRFSAPVMVGFFALVFGVVLAAWMMLH